MPQRNRQLAAIMPVRRSICQGGPARGSFSIGGFTDIVGNTALMDNDNKEAFNQLKKFRSIHKPLTKNSMENS